MSDAPPVHQTTLDAAMRKRVWVTEEAAREYGDMTLRAARTVRDAGHEKAWCWQVFKTSDPAASGYATTFHLAKTYAMRAAKKLLAGKAP